MTGPSSQRPYLRVVSSLKEENVVAQTLNRSADTIHAPRQPMLFSDASLHTLGFIKAGNVDPDKFVELIREAKPRIIFDLRAVPSFSRSGLSRRAVFSLFEEHNVTYYDVAGVLGVSEGRDSLLNPSLLVDALQVNILRATKGLSGPIFFFVNEDLFFDAYFSALEEKLPHQDGRGWDIACWPNEAIPAAPEKTRNLVFISHANPEDNDVARWLASRLAAIGYEVWSDITRLVGGEVFWDTIEDAIRKKAAKVIVLLSKGGHQKPGLLDEVNIAISTERTEKLDRFVIPMRIDDLRFSDIRANLSRKNVIDGYSDLAGALRKVVTILREDGVPTAQVSFPTHLPTNVFSQFDSIDRSQWTILHENKLVVESWPRAIRKFRGRLNIPLSAPMHVTAGGTVTFEDWDVIEATFGGRVQKAGEAAFELPYDSTALDLIFTDRAEAGRAVASLMRQAWEGVCESLGFIRFQLANNNSCWFLRAGFVSTNRVKFLDHNGIERQKALVGMSPRKNAFWHFAIEARPSTSDKSFRIIPHVIFSADGQTPLASHDRQHALRRSFCRNWWNARWRDLLSATLFFMSGGAETLRLPVSQRGCIEVSARLKSHNLRHLEHGPVRATSKDILKLDEPKVAVGFGQTSDYPKEGLFLFGPVQFERNPREIKVGLIATKEGIELFRAWSKQFGKFQIDPMASRNSMPFPGFEAVFGAKWNIDPTHTIALSRTDLINTILLRDRHQAIFKASSMYVDAITKAVREDDIGVDIWYVVIPDEVFVYGRPASRVPSAIAIASPGAMGRNLAKRFQNSSPSLFPEDNEEAKIYDHHLDFHHQLKARLLDTQAVTQILRESSLVTITSSTSPENSFVIDPATDDDPLSYVSLEYDLAPESRSVPESYALDENDLEGNELSSVYREIQSATALSKVSIVRQMQDRASVAWNLSTTTFFKAGGRPWRVASAREGVCYIGLIFKRDPNARSSQSCCGAQLFLQDSDGLVFKGAMGPWYSPETGQFHLTRSEARRLISTVLTSYLEEHSAPPRELFIHGRTRFNDEEWVGFCEAIDSEKTRLVGIRITRSNEYKLFSSGDHAVLRGTALRLGRRVGLLWTSGFIERLGTYPGRETPNPLRIEIVHDTLGQPDLEIVMQDIMMLTKMNFNSCIYGDGIPVTMRFADAIGDVLVTTKDKKVPPLPFRYYI